MNKEEYIKIIEESDKGTPSAKKFLLSQINNYYYAKNSGYIVNKEYNIGDDVYLKKGTLLHGTYKNIDGLKEIVKDGLISSWFVDARGSKYPSSVGVWNLKQDYLLKDYINFYSGGTVSYFNHLNDDRETEVIPFNEMSNFIDRFTSKKYLVWKMEQTKEARFMPSLVQDIVQIGIIFDGNNDYIKELLKGDILEPKNIDDELVQDFVNENYYTQFIKDRKNKDDFFTDRESAILFGIPANFIEGILVGRIYEKDNKILNEIKSLIPNAYICNLDGKIIVSNKHDN
jgi:hypothetical protein